MRIYKKVISEYKPDRFPCAEVYERHTTYILILFFWKIKVKQIDILKKSWYRNVRNTTSS